MKQGPASARRRLALSIVAFLALGVIGSFTAGAHEEHVVDFNSGPLEHNETFSFAFQETGTYHYGCTEHADEPERRVEVYLARGDAEGIIVGDVDIVIEDGVMWIEKDGERTSADQLRILRSAEVRWTNLDDPDVHGYHTVTLLRHESADAHGAETPGPGAALALGASLATLVVAACLRRP